MVLVYGAGLMEETLILPPGQQTSPIMAVVTKNLYPQTLMLMASGMISMAIPKENLYVSITQVLSKYCQLSPNNNKVNHCFIL